MLSYVGFLALLLPQSLACTTLVAGRRATRDGSVMVSHSDDVANGADARLCQVPAKHHAKDSRRHVYFWVYTYPRYVGYDRCSIYEPKDGQKMSTPIGSIPQANYTFAYYEGATYGLMNEHGVGIGESTCSGVFGTNASGHGGVALLSFDELSRLAMERTRSAREAVQLIGGLAEKYGFYGTDSAEGSAESFLVSDPDEAFIFHILPDPTGSSAIWAAQRVPDDHVGVVANMFVIRTINFNDPVNFLFSKNMQRIAQDYGWWHSGPFDFTRIYSKGEFEHKYYSGRRVWQAYRRFGLDLPDTYADLRYDALYPVTAKPSRAAIGVQDLFSIHRDHYEGSKYDMTKGLAAGPWGSPDRWTTTSKHVKGNWERSISIFRASSTLVVQSRRQGQGSVLWYGPHNAATSCFMPLAVGTAVPSPYTLGDPDNLSHDSAYWAHKYVFNVAQMRYQDAMVDISILQGGLEARGEELVRSLDVECSSSCDPARQDAAYSSHAFRILQEFWALPDKLIFKYGDGYFNDGQTLGYPDWWLQAVGYQNGPPPPPPESCDVQAQRCANSCAASGFRRCASECLQVCDVLYT